MLIPTRTCVNQYSKGASDPIGAFLAVECEYDPEYYELRDALIDAYKDYAKSLNTTVEGNRVFFDRVRSVPGVSVDRKKRLRPRKSSEDEDLDEFFGDNLDNEAAEALPTSRQKTVKTIMEGEDGEKERESGSTGRRRREGLGLGIRLWLTHT